MTTALRSDGFYYENGVYYAPAIDPNDELDYTLDFSGILGADEIDTVAWAVSDPTKLTIVTGKNSNTTKTATVWLKSGVAGSSITVTCTVTTIGARKIERSFVIPVKDL